MNVEREHDNLAMARGAAMARLERVEWGYRVAFGGAVAIEGAFLLGYLALADFSNRTHLLLFLATIATYTIIAFGLIALGMHMSRCTLRVLTALEQSRLE